MLRSVVSFATHPLCGEALGVAASLVLTTFVATNRPGVSKSRVFFRALPGFALLFPFWYAIASVAYFGLATKLSTVMNVPAGWGVAVVVGMVVPQLPIRNVVTHPNWVGRALRGVSALAGKLTEATHEHIQTTISREATAVP